MSDNHATGKIIVTGSNGFIGKSIVSFLREKNLDVFPVSREVCDLLDTSSVENLFTENKVSAVVHCAARTGFREDPEEYEVFYQNLLIYENLSKYLPSSCLFFHLGSGAEFDHNKDISNYRECDLGSRIPTNPYGFSKYVIAQRVAESVNQVNLRLFNIFGPQESENRFIKSAIHKLLQKEPIVVFNDKIMDFFFIDDLCALIFYYIQNYRTTLNPGLPRDVNVCYEEKTTLQEVANIINSFSSEQVPVWVRNYKRNKKNYYGCGGILSSLEVPLLGLRKGLKKTIKEIKK